MKLEYKKRIYWLLRFILIVCVVNVLTGMYEVFTSNYNVTANQIIWRGARYNWDRNIYRNIDEIENLSELPKECDIRDIWAVASYYAKDDAECESRLIELENIYNDQGEKQVIENILEHDLGDDKKTRMEYLIVAGILTKDLDKGTELLNTALNYCFDRDLGVLGYKRYIDIGDKLYRKNEKVEEIIKAFEILSKYTVDYMSSAEKILDKDRRDTYIRHYFSMIQLFQTFSGIEYFDNNLISEKFYGGDNKKYIIRAVKSDSTDISLYYRMYKPFIKLGKLEIYGRYKNLDMRVYGLMIGSLDDRDVTDYISLKYLSTLTFIRRLNHLESTSDIFELCAAYTLVYDTDIHLIEGTAYAIYPTYKIFDYHGYKDMVDTKDAIRNFNTNFSKGGYFGEFANEVGYDENNPITEENFGERLVEIFNMEYKCYEILGQEYGFDFKCITLDLSGKEPLKRKD